jgi:hypothetical protein
VFQIFLHSRYETVNTVLTSPAPASNLVRFTYSIDTDPALPASMKFLTGLTKIMPNFWEKGPMSHLIYVSLGSHTVMHYGDRGAVMPSSADLGESPSQKGCRFACKTLSARGEVNGSDLLMTMPITPANFCQVTFTLLDFKLAGSGNDPNHRIVAFFQPHRYSRSPLTFCRMLNHL